MNRYLLLFIALFPLLLSWSSTFRHFLRTWFAHLRSKPSISKRKRENKSRPYPSHQAIIHCAMFGRHRIGSHLSRENLTKAHYPSICG